MSRLNSLALFTLLLSAMVYGIIEWRSALNKEENIIDDELSPDFIAETLKSDIFTDEGKLSHTIEADRMEHYSTLAMTHFELPNYTLHPKNSDQPWKLTAKEATLYKDNRVVLNHRVRLKSTDQYSLIEEIHCKYLELDLTTNIISSEQTVMVIGKDFTMYGSGLIIDLNTKQMTLTEHVRTIYKKKNDD
ncbi:LPS export ABC transporter periplasmic protein LptC [Colwellia sp. RSH04]|uniref:LPS export ABC transporter periplasmic protein LptC n=1 Tax=Colwellia sp. RSH04 TaxID=2305464 RepID=UPI000E596D7D|nr:LPS export ABC transporter periplasmic protein LptC [Colwellia sp. RSH04]RHW76886.1 LPS export ABC transporter periplasmic protein LptC [Colwellia sp. RSH04]